MSILDIFESQKTCEYKGETYIVRDNGSIYRCRKRNKRTRPLDEKWTFGRPCKQNGYMNFASETVHRIVATAFHGKQPTERHIVDHIDTNRKNNRPENLRWITRLENLLLNPITLSRIIFKYGSIDNFLMNPSLPLDGKLDNNFEWMRTVTKEESDNTITNLIHWAKEDKIPKGSVLGEWIFSNYRQEITAENYNAIITVSFNKNAIQKNWEISCEFPICPTETEDCSVLKYRERLAKDMCFSINQYGESKVKVFELSEDFKQLFVLTSTDGPKPFALAKIYIENDKYVHESLGTFFTLNGAQKQFTLALGREWNGENSIDDFC